jgi:peptide/nickel transport system permease protein
VRSGLGAYVTRRLIQLVPLLVLMSLILYTALSLMPGDPLYRMVSQLPGATPEDYLRLRSLYGLDDPFYLRYAKWLWAFVHGQPGYSLQYSVPVMDLITPRLVNTLLLSVSALLIGSLVAVAIGIYAAVHRYSWADYASMALAFVGFSVPAFWLALILVVLFSVQLQWLPASGLSDPRTAPGLWSGLVDRVQHLILPISVLAFSETAATSRFMRSSLLDVLNQDFLRTARAKGLTEQAVVLRHALRNALIPVVTVIAVSIPRVIGSAVVIETIFNYPGMSKLLYDAIMANDFPLVMPILLIVATLVVVFNLAADVVYGYLDPRIRYT